MEKLGHKWDRWDDGYATTVHERFFIGVWPYGDEPEWSVKVWVNKVGTKNEVGINLGARPTMEESMQAGLAWVEMYLKDGPTSYEATLETMFREYKTLFRTIADADGQLFFTIGNGYEWLDGAIIRTNQEPDPGKHFRTDTSKFPKEIRDVFEKVEAENEALPIGPIEDKGEPRFFYPLSDQHSNLCLVPDDARSDWVAAAYMAALMYRNRATPSDDTHEERKRYQQARRYAAGIAVDLDRRFANVKPVEWSDVRLGKETKT